MMKEWVKRKRKGDRFIFWIRKINLSPFLKISSFFLFCLLILSIGISGCSSNSSPVWTIMVYMAGDNDLSSSILSDFGEMEAAGSTGLVNVVVQIDTYGGTTKRLLVKRGQSLLLDDLGEQNMASPQTLKDFVIWAKGHYPASRYALILSSHGDGLAKRLPGPPMERIQQRILQDDTDGVRCCLANALVQQALEDTGIYFDILGFDASQMGQIETAYEFRNLSDVLIFSQETGQANGWDYTAILNGLEKNPLMRGDALAKLIVDSYRSFYEGIFYPENNTPVEGRYLTISSIRLGSSINQLAFEIDNLSGLLMAGLTGDDAETRGLLLDAIGEARDQAGELKLNSLTAPYVYVDLFDLMNKLMDSLKKRETGNSPFQIIEVDKKIETIITLKDKVILSEYHGVARPNAHGLSLTFFKLPEALQYQHYYEISRLFDPYTGEGSQVQFFHDTRWDEFLKTYYQKAGLL